MSHENGEGDEMQTDKGVAQAFVIAGEAPEASHPGEAAFNDPTSGQEDEATLGDGQLDDLETDAVFQHIQPVKSA